MSTKNSKKEDYQKNFSNEMMSLIKKMNKYISDEMHVPEVTTEFFIMFMLEQEDSMLYKAINSFLSGTEIDSLHDTLYQAIEGDLIVSPHHGKVPEFSKEMKNFFTKADRERESMGCQFTTSDHVLLAILSKTGKSNTKKIVNSTGLTYDILYDSAIGLHDFTETIAESGDSEDVTEQTFEIPFPFTGEMFIISSSPSQSLINPPQQSKKKGAGIQFCKNLNGLASIGKIDTLIGRRDIISEMERVFARRKCNNVILVGNSGAGKSSVVEGLAKLIYEKEAPISLLGKTIYSLKVNDITSGTNMRGMFEERIGGVFQQLRQQKNCILFIDDAHTIINQRKNDEYDIMPIIIENITNGDLQVILATTQSGYRDIANSSPDFKRRFNRINVDPLSLKDTIEVLNGIKSTYEEYHSVKYTDEAISACAKLAERYIPEISLPTSAIDIIDEAGAMKKLEFINHSDIVEKMVEVNALIKKKNDYIKKDKIDKAEEAEAKIRELKADITEFEKEYGKPINEVTVDDVYKAISQHTGIPVSKVTVSERKILSDIEETLKKVVIGQDEAVQAIANAIRRNKVGLYKRNKPVLSAFLCGPTGCGKSLIAKTLAKEIFGDEKYLVRFDMSEYSDKTSVNKLIGAGAGYVGYDNGGLLTEAIKNKKHAVLLFDEIEKADDEVYNLLLQVIDEATLTDNMGNKVDFKNTVILMTSNVGARKAELSTPIGFSTDIAQTKKDVLEKELKNKFPPEFLNRLDEIIFFNTLTDEDIDAIIDLELKKSVKRIEDAGYSMEYDKNAIDFIFNAILDERNYGARPIIRVIQSEIENKITDMIINNDYDTHHFKVTADQDNIIVE